MGPMNELLASSHLQTLEFFLVSLRDVSDPSVDTQELLYNASVLAHYAQISTSCDDELGAPANLSSVFDRFVTGAALLRDGTIMETAGAQCLMLTGFFEDQMRGRHNIRWYAELGAGFFMRAASNESSARKARLLTALAYWRLGDFKTATAYLQNLDVQQLSAKGIEGIQQGLQDQGYSVAKIDGKAGMNTRSLIGAYQKANNLKVDCWPTEALLTHVRAKSPKAPSVKGADAATPAPGQR